MILIDLAVALALLVVYKFQLVPVSRALFLLGVNVNMMITALAAAAGAVVLLRQGMELDRVFGWLLLATVGLLLAGELLSFGLEYRPAAAEQPPGAETKTYLASTFLVMLTGRLGLAVLLLRCIWRPPSPRAARGPWIIAWGVAAIFVVGWGCAAVLLPLLPGGGRELGLAVALLVALALVPVALWRGGTGAPRTSPGRFWPLLGLCLYSATDLYYLQHMVVADESFCLAEMGFYAGYLLVAGAGLSRKA